MLTQEQLQQRLSYVTGSDAAAICGLSPHRTPFAVWMEKTGKSEPDDLSNLNHIKFGNYMEDGVAKWFEAESGKKLKPNSVINGPNSASSPMLVHKDYPWMAGNVDRFLADENAILECKTAYNDQDWGRDTNEMPTHYLLQVAHYCAVGNFDKAYVAVVFTTTREMRWYEYERSLKLEEKLIKAESDFWHNHVLTDIMPPPLTENDIKLMYPAATSFDPYYASTEEEVLVIKYKALDALIAEQQEQLRLLRDKLCVRMGDKQLMVNEVGERLISWKFSKAPERFDSAKFKQERPEMYKHYSKTGNASRPFRVLTPGDKNE
ncbi:MAG: YqaJ viral recombinase family protein [Candidatus Saccharibacteria bacterium]|nr:YqaJ viral recombinase family protein [Candidatus Saccharibacteria bacterium]